MERDLDWLFPIKNYLIDYEDETFPLLFLNVYYQDEYKFL